MFVSESDQDLNTSWSSVIRGVWVCDVWVSAGNSHYQSSETILAAQVWVKCGRWCLVVGNRVVMPSPGQSAVLSGLHEIHPGVSKMKALARSYVYGLNLDRDIEQLAKGCQTCQVHRKDPAGVPLHPWEWPSRPWYRVHADFLGQFLGKDFLLLIDAHSKRKEMHIIGSTSAEATIEKMEMTFASTGLPVHLVTDNGPQFVSERFASFCAVNEIKQLPSAPYHLSTNGLAERGVQVFKRSSEKCSREFLGFGEVQSLLPQC